MGPHVRAHLPLPAVLSAGLPQPASLAGQPRARGGHRLSAMLERVHELRQARAPAAACRRTDAARSRRLRPEVAGLLHAVLYSGRTGNTQAASIGCSSPRSSSATIWSSIAAPHSTSSPSASSMPIEPSASPTRSRRSSAAGSPSCITASCRPKSNTWTSPTR